MQLEISFHNLYHFYKEKYKEQNKNDTRLSPDEDYDDNIHYPYLNNDVQESRTEVDNTVLLDDNNIKYPSSMIIEDLKNEISSIETNNPICIKINTKIKKMLFKKVKIYTITSNGNGNIKIKYNNGKPDEIKPFYSISNKNTIKLGSLSGDQQEYWLKDDPFISNKYIDCMYTYSTSKYELQNHINTCYKVGSECKFVYNNLDINNIKDEKYMSKYMHDFTEYIDFISRNTSKELDCTLIYEPDFYSYIYKNSNRNPNNMHIHTEHAKLTVVQFISQIETICISQRINCVNVCNSSIYNELIYKVNNIGDINVYKNDLIYQAKQMSDFLSYFQSHNTKYLAFKINNDDKKLLSNDEYLAHLLIIKCVLESLNLEGILFDLHVGHVNGVKSISKYTNKPYENHIDKQGDYQGTDTFFLFGGCALFNDIKFQQNKFNDTGLIVNGFTVCCDEHISLCHMFNIKYIMFGSRSLEDTTNVPLKSRGNKCTDHNYTICKITEYYNTIRRSTNKMI